MIRVIACENHSGTGNTECVYCHIEKLERQTCACRFDKNNEQIKWCGPHADMRNLNKEMAEDLGNMLKKIEELDRKNAKQNHTISELTIMNEMLDKQEQELKKWRTWFCNIPTYIYTAETDAVEEWLAEGWNIKR